MDWTSYPFINFQIVHYASRTSCNHGDFLYSHNFSLYCPHLSTPVHFILFIAPSLPRRKFLPPSLNPCSLPPSLLTPLIPYSPNPSTLPQPSSRESSQSSRCSRLLYSPLAPTLPTWQCQASPHSPAHLGMPDVQVPVRFRRESGPHLPPRRLEVLLQRLSAVLRPPYAAVAEEDLRVDLPRRRDPIGGKH